MSAFAHARVFHSPTQLACVKCYGPLAEKQEEFYCARCCLAAGKRIRGIPCFTDPDYYWGEISRERMQEANRLAREIGWQASVERTVPGKPLRDFICDSRRADFQYIWDIPAQSAILEIGSDWGAIACALGHRFSRVVAVEDVLDRASFVDTRVREMKLAVEPICADFLHIPLAAEQFDVVVINGGLQRAATRAEGAPREIQLHFLRSVRNLLKADGFICLAAANRIGLAALRGGRPNAGHRGYTYSLRGYRRLLREAGFEAIRSFHDWSGGNKPYALLPLENRAALLHFAENHYLLGSGRRTPWQKFALKAAARTGLWPHFASKFVFLARTSRCSN